MTFPCQNDYNDGKIGVISDLITVSRTAITLFGLQIHFYGLLIVTGMALGVILAGLREKRLGLPKDTSVDLALICLPSALVGARIYYVLFSWKDYVNEPFWKIFAVWEGGLAIYGGILAGLLAGFLYARKKKIAFLRLGDLVAPSLALGQAIGRWGNFVNREAYGSVVTNANAQFFPLAVDISGTWHYATFFYESVWCFLIVIAILTAERKRKFVRTGDIFLSYVFLYALERGVVEGLRTDSLVVGPVRVSQMLSVLAALAITVLLWLRTGKHLTAGIAFACALGNIAFACAGCTWGMLICSGIQLIFAIITYSFIRKKETTL